MAFERKIATRKSTQKGGTTILLYTIKMWPRPQAIRILVYIWHILPSFTVFYAQSLQSVRLRSFILGMAWESPENSHRLANGLRMA
jgi:hypothetical protein